MVSEPPLYNPCGGDLALDFVDSIGRRATGFGRERLGSYADLLRWSREAGILSREQAEDLGRGAQKDERAAASVLRRARELREALFIIFQGELSGASAPGTARATFDGELARALSFARVAPGENGWAWGWADVGELDAPLWSITRAAADLLVSPDLELLKECASDTCLWLFVDRSRNHRRRWCEMKGCGNLAKVRRHRAIRATRKSRED